MTLTLVLEHSPHRQQAQSYVHQSGELTIGRGDDAGWKIDDPDKFISRHHCVISDQNGQFSVTDASSGGLFIDGASTALGPGNSAELEHGMRLRMGDFVMRAELDKGVPASSSTHHVRKPSTAVGFEDDDFFSMKSEPVEQAERPETLPDPFERSSGVQDGFDSTGEQETAPPLFDDAFTLDPVSSPSKPEPPAPVRRPVPVADIPAPPPQPKKSEPAAAPTPEQQEALLAAFFDGLGVGDDMIPVANQADEMREMGKRFRLLVDGLMHMLRARAKEKQNVRVAQTIIGAQDVNPLKFLATTDEALEALIKPRGRGYLEPNAAIEGAFRDLADHQLRTWAALQSALRRMIDNFDPDTIEKEMENTGLLEALLAGGKSAKLWQLYEERYQEIAKAAEDRFLGEVGSDFRDAYEQNRRN